MKELIELRDEMIDLKQKAFEAKYNFNTWRWCPPDRIKQRGREQAFALIIKRLNVVLNKIEENQRAENSAR